MIPRGLALAAAAALLAVPTGASAQSPPPNDHYDDATPVNQPGKPLPRRTTLRGEGDTSAATEQPDLYTPPKSGGPPEPLQCPRDDGTVSTYGKTVWWDFFPDRPAAAKIEVNSLDGAFNPVIGVIEYSLRSGAPRSGLCIDRLSSPNEELQIPVRRGRAYSVQIGGVGAAGGPYEVLFDFLRLPRVEATPTLKARPTANGIRVTSLTVEAPRGARVTVKCTRKACKRQARTASRQFVGHRPFGRLDIGGPTARPTASWSRNAGAASAEPRATSSKTVAFRNVRNKNLKAGTRLRIYISQPDAIGRYIEYRVVRGNFKRTNRCLDPGSTRPRSCSGL